MSVTILETFFKNLWFYHLEFNNAYAIYGTKIHSMFQKETRYIFVFVDTTKVSSPLSLDPARLVDLPWVSLQTRLISKDSDHYNRQLVFQELKFDPGEGDTKLRIQNRSAENSVYLSEEGLFVSNSFIIFRILLFINLTIILCFQLPLNFSKVCLRKYEVRERFYFPIYNLNFFLYLFDLF